MSWMVRRRSWCRSCRIRATLSGVVQLVCLPVCSSSSTDVRPVLKLGMPFKHLRTTQDLVPEGFLNHCEGLSSTFPKTDIKSDAHSLYLFSGSSWILPQVTYTTPNKRTENWPRPPSYVQLGTHSLDMLVLPSTGASRYHNCCVDSTSPECLGYHLVHTLYYI
jgi:hypothetical protein